MKKAYLLILVLLFQFNSSFAQGNTNGLQSRLDNETSSFVEKINQQHDKELIKTADLIAGTGITDQKLFDALEVKINDTIEQYSTSKGKGKRDLARELNALMRAIGAVGAGKDETITIINSIRGASNSSGIRNRAHRLVPKLSWYKSRNKIMGSPENYQPNQKLMTHKFANLVASNQPRMGRWAAEEIFRRRGSEEIVYMKMMEALEKGKYTTDPVKIDMLSWYSKTLKKYYSESESASELLSNISNDGIVHKKLRRYAR